MGLQSFKSRLMLPDCMYGMYGMYGMYLQVQAHATRLHVWHVWRVPSSPCSCYPTAGFSSLSLTSWSPLPTSWRSPLYPCSSALLFPGSHGASSRPRWGVISRVWLSHPRTHSSRCRHSEHLCVVGQQSRCLLGISHALLTHAARPAPHRITSHRPAPHRINMRAQAKMRNSTMAHRVRPWRTGYDHGTCTP